MRVKILSILLLISLYFTFLFYNRNESKKEIIDTYTDMMLNVNSSNFIVKNQLRVIIKEMEYKIIESDETQFYILFDYIRNKD